MGHLGVEVVRDTGWKTSAGDKVVGLWFNLVNFIQTLLPFLEVKFRTGGDKVKKIVAGSFQNSKAFSGGNLDGKGSVDQFQSVSRYHGKINLTLGGKRFIITSLLTYCITR